jgi:hypothetical protein
MGKTTVIDYLRLAKANPTVTKEFEVFKESVFNPVLDCTKSKYLRGVVKDPDAIGISYDVDRLRFVTFDSYRDLSYEEAAAVAYTKFYRDISAFILPLDSRIIFFDIAYNLGRVEAIKIMQTCCEAPEDGIIGPATREKMQFVTPQCLIYERERLPYIFARQLLKLRRWLEIS